jgi:hypothetical protein
MEELASDDRDGVAGERPNADWWYSRAALLYFFAAGEPAVAIKIGVTTIRKEKEEVEAADWVVCIRQRQQQIQSSNHETIRLLGIIKFPDGASPARDAERLEQELHKTFAQFQRFRPHTRGSEWFTPDRAIWDYINKNTKGLPSYHGVIGLPINR